MSALKIPCVRAWISGRCISRKLKYEAALSDDRDDDEEREEALEEMKASELIDSEEPRTGTEKFFERIVFPAFFLR